MHLKWFVLGLERTTVTLISLPAVRVPILVKSPDSMLRYFLLSVSKLKSYTSEVMCPQICIAPIANRENGEQFIVTTTGVR